MKSANRAIDPKAALKIVALEGPGGPLEPGTITVEAQYNPKEVSVDATAPYQDQKGVLEFTLEAPQAMTFELFFDGFETGESVVPDVLKLQSLTKKLNDKGELARPPKVKIIWGARGSSVDTKNLPPFTGVVESVSVKYQMFSSEGDVLRASATVKVKEAKNVRVGRTK
jgi:hypothetical protein